MRTTRHMAHGALFLVLASGGLLTACSAPKVADAPGYPGEATRTGEVLQVEGADSIKAWADAEVLIVTTLGSGSCPTVPHLEGVNENDRTVSITTSVPNEEGPCTADLAPRTFELEAGRDLTGYVVQVAPR